MGLHHAEHGTLGFCHDTTAVAVRACLVAAILGSSASACLAWYIFADLYLLFTPTVYFFEGEFDLDAKVRAAQHASLRSAGSAETAETAAKATTEKVAEYASKLREDVVHIHTALAVGSIHSGHAELVVARLLVGVAQHIVSFCSLLELLLCFFVAGVAAKISLGILF